MVQGDLLWNLPAQVNYRPGTRLPFSLSAVNLEEQERQFMLRTRTLDRLDRVITEDVIVVNGLSWFAVIARDREVVDGSLVLQESDVVLGVFLVERETAQEVAAVYTYLRSY